MRSVLRALLAGGLGLAAAFLVACGGGSGLLSTSQSGTLSSQLDQVAAAVSQGNCNQAGNAVTNFSNAVDSLSGVNPRLVANLQQGASTLSRLAAKNCQTTTTSSTTTSSPTTSTTTTSSPTTSTPTTTATTTSTPTTTSSATTGTGTGTSPSGGGGIGGGGGNGGGSGNGGAGLGPGNGQ